MESLKKYVNYNPTLYLINTFTDSESAVEEILKSKPFDILLLDVEMYPLSGFDLVKILRHKIRKFVFMSDDKKYSYDAIKLGAADYLCNPFDYSEFSTSISRVLYDYKDDQYDQYLLIKSKEDGLKMYNIIYSDIVAVESKLNYVMIHTTNRRILTYMSLTEISEILSRYPRFVKFNRSFIISTFHIDFITGNSLTMVGGLQLTAGDFYKVNFDLFVQSRLIKRRQK